MNKTIIININSIVFHIEEDAYETLRSYMIEIKRHFSQSADSGEILLDIENRIAEMFSERIQAGRKEVLTSFDVDEVISQMGRVSDFEEVEGQEEKNSFEKSEPASDINEDKQEEPKRLVYEKKLLRDADNKVISGVCAGLGYYFGIQAKWIRVFFVLFFLFGGSGVLLYAVLWIVMPEASTRADRMAMRGEEPNLQNFKKNFEEELDSYKDEFHQAKGHITKGAAAVTSGIGSFFRFFGKGLAFLTLIFCGMVIFGMFVCFFGFTTGVLGLQDDMVFPGTTMLPTGQAIIALAAGCLAITIPFVSLFHILIRVLFKTRPMNHYFSLSLWAGWIASILLVIFFIIIGAQEYKESSTIKVEKVLQKQDVYHFTEKDIRVIDGDAIGTKKDKKYVIEVDGEELSSYLRSDINISFEYLDSLQTPYIQYNYFAKGKTRHLATERASRIQYAATQEKGKIVFASHFGLPSDDMYRDQSVSVVVYLPIGSKVVLDESMAHKVWSMSIHDCFNEYSDDNRTKETEWIMKKSGLICAPNHKIVAKPIVDADKAIAEAEREIEKAEMKIKKIEEATNVTVKASVE